MLPQSKRRFLCKFHLRLKASMLPLVIRDIRCQTLAHEPSMSLGTFGFRARSSQAIVIESPAEDPFDDGRTRAVTFATPNNTSYVSGAVSWPLLPQDPQQFITPNVGNLQAQTLSAKATLWLGNANPPDEGSQSLAESHRGCVVP